MMYRYYILDILNMFI